jgi:hypothetical protein
VFDAVEIVAGASKKKMKQLRNMRVIMTFVLLVIVSSRSTAILHYMGLWLLAVSILATF